MDSQQDRRALNEGKVSGCLFVLRTRDLKTDPHATGSSRSSKKSKNSDTIEITTCTLLESEELQPPR